MNLLSINKNYITLLIAAFLYSSVALFTKNLAIADISPIDQVFWRIFVAFLCSLLLSRYLFKQSLRINKHEAKLLFINSIIFVYGFITWVLAIYYGSPITKALSLVFAYPLWISLFTYIVFKKKPTLKNIIAIVIVIISINLILETWKVTDITQINLGDFFAILNSIAYSALIVWGAKIRTTIDIHPMKMLSTTLAFALPVLIMTKIILSVLKIGVFMAPITYSFSPDVMLNLFGIGFIGTALTLVLIYYGMKNVNPNIASILLSSELAWVYVFGIVFFGEVLKFTGILGTIGMIISVLLV